MYTPTEDLTIALAQIAVKKSDSSYNIKKHCELIYMAGEYSANYLVFPELSLTGYELELSESLAFSIDDERIEEIKKCCIESKVNGIVGAPIRTRAGIIIGSFIILNNGYTMIYSKKYLHHGEEQYFISGNLNPILLDSDENISFAICADTNNEHHRKAAYKNNTSVYISSALISPNGYSKDTEVLQKMARDYQITVFIANYCGVTGGIKAAGGSCAWNSKGELIDKLDSNTEGLLLISRDHKDKKWRSKKN